MKTTAVEPTAFAGTLILTVDLGYDPGDLVAVILAARSVDHLVVVTSDEVGGLRAELARRMLDLLGRGDVEVIAGVDLGGKRRFLPDPGQQIPVYIRPSFEEHTERGDKLVSRLVDLVVAAAHPVQWVGCGPMSELSLVLTAAPDLAEKIPVTQMAGWLDEYRRPDRAEHNLATDMLAGGIALRMLPTARLVLADHTENDAIRVTEDWDLVRALDADHAPVWARLLAAHFHRWVTRWYDGSWMGAPLTLSAALGYPFVAFTETGVRIEDDARLFRESRGRPMRVSQTVHYGAFVKWLHETVISW
ncbi:nucleoside hydrolase [Nocardia takedensis]